MDKVYVKIEVDGEISAGEVVEGVAAGGKAMNGGRAVVLMLGERYFYGFGQGGRVLTAWSLSGAALFGEWRDELAKVERKLLAAGKLPRRVVVGGVS